MRVLVVDDYPDAAESIATWLSFSGFETKIARDGVEALALANRWRPSVCIVDLAMPKCDGFELARCVREQIWAANTVLIAHTGWTSEQMRERATQAGFDCYVTKPADPKEMLRIIHEQSAKRRGGV